MAKKLLLLALGALGAAIGALVLMQILAWGWGCQVDEAGVHPCVIGGYDFGPLFADVTLAIVMGAFIAGPALVLLGFAAVGVLVVRAIVRSRRPPGAAGG